MLTNTIKLYWYEDSYDFLLGEGVLKRTGYVFVGLRGRMLLDTEGRDLQLGLEEESGLRFSKGLTSSEQISDRVSQFLLHLCESYLDNDKGEY